MPICANSRGAHIEIYPREPISRVPLLSDFVDPHIRVENWDWHHISDWGKPGLEEKVSEGNRDTIFPIYRHHSFRRLPLGIRDWELGSSNHPRR